MTRHGGDSKLLFFNPGNFTSDISVEFELVDPVDVISGDDEEGGDIEDEGFLENDETIVAPKSP